MPEVIKLINKYRDIDNPNFGVDRPDFIHSATPEALELGFDEYGQVTGKARIDGEWIPVRRSRSDNLIAHKIILVELP
jgi:hypothetical protein